MVVTREDRALFKTRIVEAKEKLDKLEPVRDILSDDLVEKLAMEERFIRALELRLDGFGLGQISDILDIEKHGVVHHWIYNGTEPLGRMNVPDFRLREDIVRILAATNTDASVGERKNIKLACSEYMLAKNFAQSLTNVLGKELDVKMHESQPGMWIVNCDSTFLADIAQNVREEPESIHRFLADKELKVDYCRLFFAYDGGPTVGFQEDKKIIQVGISAYEDIGRLEALRDILAEFGVHTSEPHFANNVYIINISGEENARLFAQLIGIEGYKGEKLADALWLKERMKTRIEEAMEKGAAFHWVRDIWETYYAIDGNHGYVPTWWQEAYEIARSDLPLKNKIAEVEKIYNYAAEQARSLRSTVRY